VVDEDEVVTDLTDETEVLRLADEYVAASPIRGRPVFLLATPESGAELLLRALDALPGVMALPSPTHLFSQGVAMIFERWHAGEDTSRPEGMAELVDEDEFLAAARLLTDAVLGAAAGSNRSDRLVEYSQGHAYQTGVIAALYPDADLVHVVRDGRQVVSRGVTPLYDWTARGGARRWREDQEAVTGHGELPNLKVVRYEDLVCEPVASVEALAAELKLSTSAADIEAAAAILARGAIGVTDPPLDHPAAIVELLAGDILETYGYQLSEPGRAHRSARLELRAESVSLAARERVVKILERVRDAIQRAQTG
jgi:hypothetical protein